MNPVAPDDPCEPRTAVDRLRVIEGRPLKDAPGPAALAPDEVFANQAPRLLEIGCDLVKVLSAGCVVDVRRQLVADGRGDHGALLASSRRSPGRLRSPSRADASIARAPRVFHA